MNISKLRQLLIMSVMTLGLAGFFISCGGGDDDPTPATPSTPSGGAGTTTPPGESDTPNPVPIISSDFAKGADVSWISELEDKGSKFYNAAGEESECMQLLRDECGVNAIRLRVWVNPADKYNSIEDVLKKARRANALGLRLMVDFHLSDNWADPGKQVTPAAWQNMSASQIDDEVNKHVSEMLNALKHENITPEWVQIGNETTPGMLHPLGEMKGNSAGEFPRFLNAGYDAVKAIFPQAQVIVHLDCGNKKDTYTWFFDLLEKNKGKYDMIGMSLYPIVESGTGPTWKVETDNKAINDCIANIKHLNSRYSKPVMICEIGFHHTQPSECSNTLKKFMNEFADGSVLKGIFYWEPEAEPSNTGYHMGAFANGRPTAALDAFKPAE